jgi:hypothetical protein
MEDYAPSVFLRNGALVASYLCFRFCIFNRPILEKYVSQVGGGPLASLLPTGSMIWPSFYN